MTKNKSERVSCFFIGLFMGMFISMIVIGGTVYQFLDTKNMSCPNVTVHCNDEEIQKRSFTSFNISSINNDNSTLFNETPTFVGNNFIFCPEGKKMVQVTCACAKPPPDWDGFGGYFACAAFCMRCVPENATRWNYDVDKMEWRDLQLSDKK